MQTLQLNTRLSNKSWVRPCIYNVNHILTKVSLQLGDENSDEEDPFAEVSLCRTILYSESTVVRLMKVSLKMTWNPIFNATSMSECAIQLANSLMS